MLFFLLVNSFITRDVIYSQWAQQVLYLITKKKKNFIYQKNGAYEKLQLCVNQWVLTAVSVLSHHSLVHSLMH